jgi:hypothetical protein
VEAGSDGATFVKFAHLPIRSFARLRFLLLYVIIFMKRYLQSHPGLKPTQLLGYDSPTITAIYTHVANRGLHDAVARLAEAPVDRLDR